MKGISLRLLAYYRAKQERINDISKAIRVTQRSLSGVAEIVSRETYKRNRKILK